MSGIEELVAAQRAYFGTGETLDPAFRRRQLGALAKAVDNNYDRLLQALARDLGKPVFESIVSEIGIVADEAAFALRHLRSWAKPRRVKTRLRNQPGVSRVFPHPHGVSLILGARNYPLQLTLTPLVGAIAAGNCAIIKPSDIASNSSQVLAELLRGIFPENYVAVVEGGVERGKELLGERFDFIFFTGSAATGKAVMQAAAQHLTPVLLELGGKNPCIVDRNVPLDTVARKIAWGKFLNAGQSCAAPDYVLIPTELRQQFLDTIARCLREFYGPDPAASPDYGRITNQAHFDRLVRLITDRTVALGGDYDRDRLYLSPTVIDGVGWDDQLMRDEVFGPLLPVIEYDSLTNALDKIKERERPLCLYLFSNDRHTRKRVLKEIAFGSSAVNDAIMQYISPYLPFGGTGESGMGRYHGKASFDAFSYRKAVMTKSLLIDPGFQYPPYRKRKGVLRFFYGHRSRG